MVRTTTPMMGWPPVNGIAMCQGGSALTHHPDALSRWRRARVRTTGVEATEERHGGRGGDLRGGLAADLMSRDGLFAALVQAADSLIRNTHCRSGPAAAETRTAAFGLSLWLGVSFLLRERRRLPPRRASPDVTSEDGVAGALRFPGATGLRHDLQRSCPRNANLLPRTPAANLLRSAPRRSGVCWIRSGGAIVRRPAGCSSGTGPGCGGGRGAGCRRGCAAASTPAM